MADAHDPAGSFQIRPGADHDWRALRMLIPEAFHHGSGARAFVATAEDDQKVIGAAAISPRLRSEPVSGPRVALHVIPPFRRRGIASRLLASCACIAAGQGAAALYAWQPLLPDSAEARAYAALGFDRSVKVEQGRADVQKSYEYLKPRYDQMVERQYIPASAKLVPLNAAYAGEIARLHVQFLGGRADEIEAQVRGQSPVRYHPDLSPMILFDGQVMGFTLARLWDDGNVLVDSQAIHPLLRQGWANLWLKFAGVCACRDMQIRTILFYSYDRHTDTRKLSRKVGVSSREMIEPYALLETLRFAGAPPTDERGDRNPGPA
jgi:N-acetylglutamate synthase-like GNAT family acetyltransferase